MALLGEVLSDRSRREPGDVAAALRRQAETLGGAPDVVISGATGVKGITDEELDAIQAFAGRAPVHATGDLVGHAMEAQAPIGAALAAALIAEGRAGEALVTSVGHRRGEGMLKVTRA